MSLFAWDLDDGERYAIQSSRRNSFYAENGDLHADHRDREVLSRFSGQSAYPVQRSYSLGRFPGRRGRDMTPQEWS